MERRQGIFKCPSPRRIICAAVLSLLSFHLRRRRMLLASAVVVWEWLNEHGRWRPYSPAVCHHIEAVIRSDPRCGSVVLGQVDSRLSPYIIDLHSMHQFRQDTGEEQGGRHTAERGVAVQPGPRWRPPHCSCVSALSIRASRTVQLHQRPPLYMCVFILHHQI